MTDDGGHAVSSRSRSDATSNPGGEPTSPWRPAAARPEHRFELVAAEAVAEHRLEVLGRAEVAGQGPIEGGGEIVGVATEGVGAARWFAARAFGSIGRGDEGRVGGALDECAIAGRRAGRRVRRRWSSRRTWRRPGLRTR